MRTLWQGLLPLLPTLTSSLTPCLALFLSNIAKCAILLWHPTPVLLPGKSRGWRSLEGCSPWGRWGSDTTERLHFHFSLSRIGEGNGNPLQCSCLENPRDGGAWWASVYGVAQSRTRLKWLSSSSRVWGPVDEYQDVTSKGRAGDRLWKATHILQRKVSFILKALENPWKAFMMNELTLPSMRKNYWEYKNLSPHLIYPKDTIISFEGWSRL